MEDKKVANAEIRQAAETSKVRLWQIGEQLNMCDSNFSRMLRKELNSEVKAQILTIIEHLKIQKK